MDLLLHLLEKNEVDIYNIPVALITQQYLEYLSLAGEVDLELTSEFLVMACTLLTLKARMLLPKQVHTTEEEEGEDPRQELVERLLEYKIYKEKAQEFKEMELKQAKVFWREIDEARLVREFPPSNPLGSVSPEELFKAYHQVLRKVEKRMGVVSITRESITIQEKMVYILHRLDKKASGLSFYQLFSQSSNYEEVIVTFLALLELTRRGMIILRQSRLFSDILIFLKDTEGRRSNSAHFVS